VTRLEVLVSELSITPIQRIELTDIVALSICYTRDSIRPYNLMATTLRANTDIRIIAVRINIKRLRAWQQTVTKPDRGS
jgi:hypothetical protein